MDFAHEQLFGRYRGGYADPNLEDSFDDDNMNGGGDEGELTDFFKGGIKDEEKSSYTVKTVSDGSFEGGRYISATPGGAARKAATAIFRHIDTESGVRAQSKSAKRAKIPINTALAKLYNKKNPIKNITFVILRIDRNDLRKYFAYTAVREKIAPKTIKKNDENGNPIVITSKVTVKPTELPEEYKAENKQFQKVKAAKARAIKDKEEGKKPARKPRAAAKAKGEAKAKKPAAAKKAAKGKGVPSLADIVKALTVSSPVAPAKKPAKTPRAAKKPAAPKAKKAAAPKAKKTGGDGYCSFF